MKKQKLLTLIFHGTEAPLYTKKYIPLCISPYTGQIQLAVDNKNMLYKFGKIFHTTLLE